MNHHLEFIKSVWIENEQIFNIHLLNVEGIGDILEVYIENLSFVAYIDQLSQKLGQITVLITPFGDIPEQIQDLVFKEVIEIYQDDDLIKPKKTSDGIVLTIKVLFEIEEQLHPQVADYLLFQALLAITKSKEIVEMQ